LSPTTPYHKTVDEAHSLDEFNAPMEFCKRLTNEKRNGSREQAAGSSKTVFFLLLASRFWN
jgi:hypothetical protein